MITRRTVKNKCIIFCYYITKSQSHDSNLWVKWTNNGFVLVMCRTQWSNQSVQTSAISFVGKSIISPQYVHYTECWFKMLHSTSHIQHAMYGVKYRVPDQEADKREREHRFWKRTVKHVNWTRRMLWIIWKKLIKDVWWPGRVWVGECFFWYRPTRMVPDKGPRLLVISY